MPASITMQATPIGQQLNVAQTTLSDGSLLLPYGDYDANTGPIDVIAYNPADNSVRTLFDNLADEQIWDYRRLDDGRLATCITDPQGRDPATIAWSKPDDELDWSVLTINVPAVGPAVHLFDIAQVSTGLYVCGARNFTTQEMTRPGANPDPEYNTAFFVWKSIDDGVIWTEDLAILKNNDGFYRPYGFGRIGDDLIVDASDYSGHWELQSGVWSVKKAGSLRIENPPIWAYDRQSFAVGSKVWRRGEFDQLVYRDPISDGPATKILAALPEGGWLWLDAQNIIHKDTHVLGRITTSSDRLRGVVGPVDMGSPIYISDRTDIYRVNENTSD